jgi:hypothetical protein
MTDRELLELAAKAAGIKVLVSFDRARRDWSWNPLDDDGAALRLAVQLGLLGAPFMTLAWIEALGDSDSYAATRRAIVRVAAEIGRGME